MVSHQILDLPDLAELLSGSSLADSSVELPEGHYAEESMKSTVVPNRNMILLAMAAGYALSIDFDTVTAALEDHTIYGAHLDLFLPSTLRDALQLADWKDLRLHRPFVNLTKAELVRIGAKLGAPLLTWSCYAGDESHCGKCGTCHGKRLSSRQNNGSYRICLLNSYSVLDYLHQDLSMIFRSHRQPKRPEDVNCTNCGLSL